MLKTFNSKTRRLEDLVRMCACVQHKFHIKTRHSPQLVSKEAKLQLISPNGVRVIRLATNQSMTNYYTQLKKKKRKEGKKSA